MNRFRNAVLGLFLFISACGGNSSPSSCAEFADEVADMIARDASGEEMTRFVEDTEEQVARLITADPDSAGPCVEAALEAVFVASFEELEQMLGE